MKVELLISRAGAGFAQKAGDVVEVSDEEGKRLLEAVPPKARPVREGANPASEDEPEKAVAPKPAVEPEKAVKAKSSGK